MKFYFFYKRVSDVDHLSPVIYSLIEEGIKPSDIYYYDLWPDKTQKNLNIDPRIKFLRSLKINIIESKLNLAYVYLAYWIIKPIPIFLAGKALRRIFYLRSIQAFFDFCLFLHLTRRLKSIVNSLNNDAIFLIEQGTSRAHLEVLKFAKKYKIKSYALPHGVITHKGLKDKSLNKEAFGRSPLRNLTKIIFPNKLAYNLSGLDSDEAEVLGSPRFSRKWINNLKNIFQPTKIIPKDKINILLLAEKDGIEVNGKFIPSIFKEEINQTVDYLSELEEVNLIIKHHPSRTGPFGAPDLGPYRSKKAINILEDKEATTFQLINECDLVIATFSSAIIDAVILKKKILILQYTSPYDLVFRDYIKNCTINSLEELKYSVNQILNETFELDEDGYKDFIYNTVEWSKSSLKDYAEFLTKDVKEG